MREMCYLVAWLSELSYFAHVILMSISSKSALGSNLFIFKALSFW